MLHPAHPRCDHSGDGSDVRADRRTLPVAVCGVPVPLRGERGALWQRGVEPAAGVVGGAGGRWRGRFGALPRVPRAAVVKSPEWGARAGLGL